FAIALKSRWFKISLQRLKMSRWMALIVFGVILIGYLGVGRFKAFWPFHSTRHQPSAAASRWFDKGMMFMRDGDYYQASGALKKAVEADGQFVLARARLAEAFSELDYYAESQTQLNEIYLSQTDRSTLSKSDSLYLKAILDVATRKYTDAINNYN